MDRLHGFLSLLLRVQDKYVEVHAGIVSNVLILNLKRDALAWLSWLLVRF